MATDPKSHCLERELACQTLRLQAVLDSSFGAMVIVDEDGLVTVCNQRFTAGFGIAEAEVRGRPFAEVFARVRAFFEDPERFDRTVADAEAARGGQRFTEVLARAQRLKAPDGRAFGVLVTPVTDRTGAPLGRCWTFPDLTQSLEVTEAAATRLRYEEALAVCAQALLASDEHADPLPEALGHLLAATEADRVRIFENFVDDTDGLSARRTHEVVAPGAAPARDAGAPARVPYAAIPRWRDALSAGTPVGVVVEHLPADERAVLAGPGARATLALPMQIAGLWSGFVAFDDLARARSWGAEDVRLLQTAAQVLGSYLERRRAYEAVRASDERHRRLVETLHATQAQLVQSEKMAALGMLVAGIAHEINTPVGAVYSMHDTLVRGVAKLREQLVARGLLEGPAARPLTTPLGAIEEANRVIQSGTTRVIEIVRRLRSFARLDEAEIKRVDLHEALEDTLALVHHELKRDVAVVRDYGALPPVTCYPGRLNQVFLNVLINARQAMPSGGTITITTRIEGPTALVTFEDTGVGIAPEALARIFDPGFTTKGVGVGTGLGLAICYRIMQDHRGEIRVESEVGRGSRFTVVLPTDLAAPA